MNEITQIHENTAVLLQTEGDLVAPRLPALRARLRDLVAAGTLQLTLDLAGASMVDSAGIGLLVATHNSLRKAGGELRVINASDEILQLFRTMRIHMHFSVSGK